MILDLAVRVERMQVDVVNEGHVVTVKRTGYMYCTRVLCQVPGVPVQAIAMHVEGHGVDQVVDWSHNL